MYTYFLFLSIIKRKSKYMNVATETQIKEKEDPKTFSLTLTGEQRKYLMYGSCIGWILSCKTSGQISGQKFKGK